MAGPRLRYQGAADTLSANLADFCSTATETWCSALTQKNGQPFIEVISGDAYVHFGPILDSVAVAACPTIASLAGPLSLTSVVVLAGSTSAAHCYPGR